MKKILNGLGVFGSIILTLILTILIFLYVVVLNIKFVVSENGMANTFKKIDVVETLKYAEDGTMWEDFMQLAESLDISEEQFEKILNSDKVKEKVGSYIGEVLSSTFNDKEANLTKEDMESFLNIAVDEYNKVSDTKISDAERKEIINSFDEEMIANMNEEFGSINLTETVAPEYVEYIKLADNLLFGNYTLIMLALIILIIGLIALFRFSCYKWMPYVKTSAIINGSLMLIVGLLILIIPLEDMEIIMPIRKLLATRVFITSAILFILSICLSVGKKYLKKYIDKKQEVAPLEKANEVSEKIEEVKQVEEKKKKKIELDKKTIIIIALVLVLLLVILFLIFGRNGSYTITFDTNGGTEITAIEVKNNEIVKLPEAPKKDGHKFVGWTNEEGKVITKGTKVTEDITLKAEWVSNDAETITAEFNTDGGNEIDNIIIEKGHIILLPIEPTRDGYIFAGWLDGNGNFITKDTIMTNNITLKAMWIKKDANTSTIKFNTDGGSKVGNIVVENGKIIVLPEAPTKTGYVFAGWVDENGNAITKDTIVNENMTIKATWKAPYTCPSDCTPIGDGSKCTKEVTKEMSTTSSCPNGYTLKNGHCIDKSTQYHAENTDSGWKCNSSSEYMYSEIDKSGMGAFMWCVKTTNKVTTKGCPSGYTQSGNICKKTETISCKAN